MHNRSVRNNRCIPCAICGNTRINEYIVKLSEGEYSYFQCDNCKIGTVGLWKKSEMAQLDWNKLMRKLAP